MRKTGLRRREGLLNPIWSVSFLVTLALSRDLVEACRQLTGRTLDLGCGNSPYKPLFSNVSEYVAYDIDASSRPQATGTAGQLLFASGTFDGVFNTQVIEHVEEPWRVLDEVARMLKPGGRLVLSAPQAWRLHEVSHDVYRYTHFGIAHLMTRTRLRVISCAPQGGTWLTIGQSINNPLWHGEFRRTTPAWFVNRGLSTLASLLVNLACLVLDRVFYGPGDTCNYVFLAERK